jgi:hypothetical protein
MSAHLAGAGALLAHQGGWDEIAFVLLPIALFVALLVVADRRADRARGEPDDPSPGPDPRT